MTSKEEFIANLQQDLAAEWAAVHRYTLQAARCTGLAGEIARELFLKEAREELQHALFLADVITDLGGEPTGQCASFEVGQDVQQMLQINLEQELADTKRYFQRAEEAEDLGMEDLEVQLEQMAAEEAEHARTLRRLLGRSG